MTPLERAALAILKTLVAELGAPVVDAALVAALGGGPIADAAVAFAAGMLPVILDVLGQDRVKAELLAEYKAADAAIDALEDEKFGPRT